MGLDAISALVFTGPLLRNPPGGRLAAAVMQIAYPLLFARPWGASTWASAYRDRFSRGRKAPWLDEHVAAIRAALDPSHLAQFRALTRQLTHEPVERRLDEVHAPALAFVGRLDPDYPDPAAEAAWLKEAVDARVVLLDGVGHYPQHQAPELVVPQLLEFLAALPQRAA